MTYVSEKLIYTNSWYEGIIKPCLVLAILKQRINSINFKRVKYSESIKIYWICSLF